MKVGSYMVLSDDVVLARPNRREGDRGECENGGVMIQSSEIKKIVRTSGRAIFKLVVLSSEGTAKSLVNEALHRSPSPFSIPQAAPPTTKPGPIDIARKRRIEFVGSSPAPSFTIDTTTAGSSIHRSPVSILTLIRFVRISAGP